LCYTAFQCTAFAVSTPHSPHPSPYTPGILSHMAYKPAKESLFPDAQTMESVRGVIERITFHNDENGYTVAKLLPERAKTPITILGNFTNPVVGESLICRGVWSVHPQWGRQMQVSNYEVVRPATAQAIEKYLGSGMIKGIGPVMAKRIVDMFGADDNSYTRRAAECFMVSAVARILWVDPLVKHNGAKVDFMLILEGLQGKGKTSAVAALFGSQWYAEAMESPASKDFYQSLQGRWCVEIGEMDSFSKADVTKVKQAITSRFDTYRPSYGRTSRSFRRQCVFVGTTNESEYLRDSTGGRRFLPVKIKEVNIERVGQLREQLWAEAVHLFQGGFKWWELPAQAAEEQEDRFVADTWEEVIEPWINGRCIGDKDYPPRMRLLLPDKIEWVTTTEILEWALRIDVGKHGKPEQMRIAPIMRRLGWIHVRPWIERKRQRRWVPKPAEGDDDPIPF